MEFSNPQVLMIEYEATGSSEQKSLVCKTASSGFSDQNFILSDLLSHPSRLGVPGRPGDGMVFGAHWTLYVSFERILKTIIGAFRVSFKILNSFSGRLELE